jgi:hypothetical protein
MAIVGRGVRGSWLRAAATGSREVGEEEVDEEDRSVAVPEEGWEVLEESDDEGPAVVGPTSSVVLTAGLSSFAFPFGSAVVVERTSSGCASSYASVGALAGSLGFLRPYRVHRLWVFVRVVSPSVVVVLWWFKEWRRGERRVPRMDLRLLRFVV